MPTALDELRARVRASCLALGLTEGEADAVAEAAVRRRQGTAAKARRAVTIAPVTRKARDGAALVVEGFGTTLVDATGALVIDHDDEIVIPRLMADAIRRAAARGPIALDVDHETLDNPDRPPVGVVVEHLVLDPQRREALGLEPGADVGWYCAARVDDPATLARVEAGDLAEFSLMFERRRVVVDEASTAAKMLSPGSAPGLAVLLPTELVNVSLVPQGAGRNVQIRARRRVAAKGSTMEFETMIAALASLTPEQLATLRAKLAEMAGAGVSEDGKGGAAPETEGEKAAKARARAAEAEALALKARVAKLEVSAKAERELRDIGEIPGVAALDVATLIATAEIAGDTATASTVRTLAKAAKAIAADLAPKGASGAAGAKPAAPATYNDAVDLEIAANPKATTEEIAKAIKSKYPSLRPLVAGSVED